MQPSRGGPYHMVSRALGPSIGGAVGVIYFLGIVFLAVLESLGIVEVIISSVPSLHFTGCRQVFGSLLVLTIAVLHLVFCSVPLCEISVHSSLLPLQLCVYVGTAFVAKLGVVFGSAILLTMLSFYVGLLSSPRSDVRPELITGLSAQTFKANLWANYESTEIDFAYILAVFFPCFTGILAGADRADVLKDPKKDIPKGAYGGVCAFHVPRFSFLLFLIFLFCWSALACFVLLSSFSHSW